MSIVISLANLIIDIFYALIDPKLRSEINGKEVEHMVNLQQR